VKVYDVIIVGTGPAGIFTALELADKEGLAVLLLEKGKDIEERNTLGDLDPHNEVG
jgi:hypothetical protein